MDHHASDVCEWHADIASLQIYDEHDCLVCDEQNTFDIPIGLDGGIINGVVNDFFAVDSTADLV